MLNTFYMVEMHYPLDDDRAAFNAFYAKHISMLLSIDGFLSAQRYVCTHVAKAPFLAVYRLRGPEVLASENYTSRAGRDSVDPVFKAKMTHWDRNLVQGELADMNVAEDGWMIVVDRLTPESPSLPEGFAPLAVVGLDASIHERGVMIGQAGEPPAVDREIPGWTVRTFKPAHPPRSPL